MMSFFSSGNLHIEADPDMPWTLDGEYQPGSEEINIRNNKSAIRIMVGRDNAAAQDVLRTAGTKENCDALRNTAPVSEILLIVNRKQVSATV